MSFGEPDYEYDFVPLPGEKAECQQGITGVVEKIVKDDHPTRDRLKWVGHVEGKPHESWETTRPVEPTF